ncbi:MAG TPA: AMP-binding protein [Acidimicrobiia bacterium]|jgi:acyl-CoA synthetase (AMP-forming)/AMP-acid ligase II|nr:AMP-binding protein [Acidimicrobiia bacterium]
MAFDWQPRDPDAQRAQGYVRAGFWNDETLGDILATGLRAAPDHLFTVRSDRFPYRGTFRDVDERARLVAAGLRARGIGPGDAVAFQLPNWVDAAATFYAIAYLGAIVVPIVHFYGAKEVGYILRRTRVKALITADRFAHQDFLANLDTLRTSGDADTVEWVAVVGDGAPAGTFAFADLLAHGSVDAPVSVDPMSPALIAYTSGTTSDPKGVVHVHRTINAEIRQLSGIQLSGAAPPAESEVIDPLTGAPVGHGIGMLAALLMPVFRRRHVHLIDVWDPKRVLAGMAEDRLSAGQGATFFLTSLLDHPDFDLAVHGPLMAHIGLGGAAVPIAVCERARAMGIECTRSFGSTEHPSITGSTFEDPWDQRARTDGKPLPGVEMRLVDEDGRDVEVGEPGEILSRGPDCFFGYTDPARTAEAIDRDGWYSTGDVGVLDADGCLAITDRKKDIIIRGGENISAQEVEELVVRLPGVAECAVVAAPDARLGEHAAVFVRMLAGHDDPSLGAVREHLEAAGLARQKWPEDVRGIDEFPRTPSGKIQKFVLRQKLRDEGA